jgi:hypothetical protein
MFSAFRIFYIAAFMSCFIACTLGRLTIWCTDLLFGDHMPDGLSLLGIETVHDTPIVFS